MKKLTLKERIMVFVGTKMMEKKGESVTTAQIGWAAVAIAVVLVLYKALPTEAETYMKKVFVKLSSGLGLA